jgi:hypothetical protein
MGIKGMITVVLAEGVNIPKARSIQVLSLHPVFVTCVGDFIVGFKTYKMNAARDSCLQLACELIPGKQADFSFNSQVEFCAAKVCDAGFLCKCCRAFIGLCNIIYFSVNKRWNLPMSDIERVAALK